MKKTNNTRRFGFKVKPIHIVLVALCLIASVLLLAFVGNQHNANDWNANDTAASAGAVTGDVGAMAMGDNVVVTLNSSAAKSYTYGSFTNSAANLKSLFFTSSAISSITGLSKTNNAEEDREDTLAEKISYLSSRVTISISGASNSSSGNLKVGKYSLSISATGVSSISFANASNMITINKRSVTISVNNQSGGTYDGTEKTLGTTNWGYKTGSSQLVSGDKATVGLSIQGGSKLINAGNYTIVASLSGDDAGNYDFNSDTGTFTINKKTTSISLNQSVSYNGEIQKATIGEGFTASNNTGWKNVGEYSVSVVFSEGDNYQCGSYTKDQELTITFKITKVSLTLTWSGTSKTYNGNVQWPTLSQNFKGQDASEYKLVVDDNASGAKTVGSYTVRIDLDNLTDNYTVDSSKLSTSFRITQKQLTISGAAVLDKPYDASTVAVVAMDDEGEQKIGSLVGICGADNVTHTLSAEFSDVKVGTYSSKNSGSFVLKLTIELVGEDAFNYSYAVPDVSATINKRELIFTGIATDVEDNTVTYGDDVPTQFYVDIDGYYEGEEKYDEMRQLLTVTCDYVKGNGVGEYSINVRVANGNLAAFKTQFNLNENYEVVFEGTLTVSPKAIEIKIIKATSVCGDPEVSIAYELAEGSEFVGSDTIADLQLHFQRTNSDISDAGVYDVECFSDNPNYQVEFIGTEGAYIITKREIEIPDILTKIYNGEIQYADETDLYGVLDNFGWKDVRGEDDEVRYVLVYLLDPTNYKWKGVDDDDDPTVPVPDPNSGDPDDPDNPPQADSEEAKRARSVKVQFEILPTDLTIDWDDLERVYNKQGQLPSVVLGLLGEDKELELENVFKLSVDAPDDAHLDPGEEYLAIKVGSYTVRIVFFEEYQYLMNNYNLPDLFTTFTIVRATLTVEDIVVDDKIYDGTTDATVQEGNIGRLVGIFEGDTVYHRILLAFFQDPNVGTWYVSVHVVIYGEDLADDINNYVLNGIYVEDGNYYLVEFAASAEITKKTLTVKAVDIDITYGDRIESFRSDISGFVSYTLDNGETYTESLSDLFGTLMFDCGYQFNKANGGAGTYPITVSGLDSDNYEIVYVQGTLTVNKKAINVTIESKSSYFGEDEQELTYTINIQDMIDWDRDDYATALAVTLVRDQVATTRVAGSYDILGSTTSANYEITFLNEKGAGAYTIMKARVKVPTIDEIEYLGVTKYLEIDTELYKVDNNDGWKNVGTYQIKISLLNSHDYEWIDYEGDVTVTVNFVIYKAQLTLTWDDISRVYNGEVQWPTLLHNFVGEDINDFKLAVVGNESGARNVNDYTVNIVLEYLENNYNVVVNGSTSTEFHITPKLVSVVGVTVFDKEYDGNANVTINSRGQLSWKYATDDVSYTIEAHFDNATAGEVKDVHLTFVLTGESSGNYQLISDTDIINAKVWKKALTITADNFTVTYGDEIPNYTVQYLGFIVGEDESYLLDALEFDCVYVLGSGVVEGGYVIRPLGYTSLNYEISYVNGTLTVNKKDITVSIDHKSSIYEQDEAVLTISFDHSMLVKDDTEADLAVVLTRANSDIKDAGIYDIEGVSTSVNYNVTIINGTNAYEILKAKVQIATYQEVPYNGKLQYAKISGAFVTDENVGFKNVGTYKINLELSDNKNFEWEDYDNNVDDLLVTFVITPIDLTIEWTVISKEYNGAAQLPSLIHTLVGEDINSFTLVVQGFATGARNVGNYTVKLELDNILKNYNISADALTTSFDIYAKEINLEGVEVSNKTYDGTTAATVANKGVLVGVCQGDVITFTISAIFADSNVGEHSIIFTIVLSGEYVNNYTLIDPVVAAEIVKKALTVTADDISVTYGDQVPTYTESYNGFIDGEDASVLTGILAFACDYAYASGVVEGGYVITPSGLTSGNYDITFVNGTLTVLKKDITVTIEHKTSVYGAAEVELTFTYNKADLVGSDTVSDLAVTLVRGMALIKDAGSYNINGTSDSVNYNVAFANGTNAYVITKAKVAVKTEQSVTYNGKKQSAEVPTGGGVNISGNDGWTDVGNHTITVTLRDSKNYEWADASIKGNSTQITFTILQAENDWVTEFHIDDWYEGHEQSVPTTPTALFGTVVVKYYLDSELKQETTLEKLASAKKGTYYVVVTVKGNRNYTDLTAKYTFNINPRPSSDYAWVYATVGSVGGAGLITGGVFIFLKLKRKKAA